MDDYAREMMELKTLVTRTLEKKGVLAKIRERRRQERTTGATGSRLLRSSPPASTPAVHAAPATTPPVPNSLSTGPQLLRIQEARAGPRSSGSYLVLRIWIWICSCCGLQIRVNCFLALVLVCCSRSMLQRERSRLLRAGDRRAAPPSGARRPDPDSRGPLPRFLRSPSPTRPHQRRPQDLRGSHQIDAAARTLQIPSSRLGSERRLRPRNRRIPSCSAAALTPTPHRLQRHAGAAQTQDFFIFLGLLIWVFGRNLEIFVSDW